MTTMQDVATRAGVSAKTVSRVFNDDPHVTEDTRERVQVAMRELKYVPNMLARTFREGKSAVIGIAVPDVADRSSPPSPRELNWRHVNRTWR